MIKDGYKTFENTEDAMFHHWDEYVKYEYDTKDDPDYKAPDITDLIDNFIATGNRG